jgi:hypothetical protein
MHTADTFEMIEIITRGALERHPVWTHYEQEQDRDVILGWGVREKTLDDEVARYEFCGPQPLFPVLQLDPLPPRPHLIVSVTFESACGTSLAGYLLEPHAFGVFAGDREFCFNRILASLAARAAAGLASALGRRPERLFPLAYSSDLRTPEGRAIRGEIAAFW